MEGIGMERLEAKKISGHTYYYYSKWGWTDGKCRRLWQKYLGRLEDIVKAVDRGPDAQYAEVFDFGLPTALWLEIQRQNVVGHVDKLCPKRRQGLSVGVYIALAAVNRAIRPVSKNAMWEWFSGTTLRRFLPDADEAALNSQRFWDHMDCVTPEKALNIWRSIISATADREKIDLSHISYDGTNFYTFLNTFNMNSQLARRGHNKQGRDNLRQINYALFCSKDGNVPLYYDLYEGNRNDARQFPVMIERFQQFITGLSPGKKAAASEVTVVFDKGNNSADNIARMDSLHLHFIGSVKLDEHKELAAVSNADPRFQPCTRSQLKDLKAFEVRKDVYGRERTVVVVYNARLFETQWKTVNADIDKALDGLAALKQRLDDRADGIITRGRAPTVSSIQKQAAELLRRPFMKELIEIKISPVPGLEYQLHPERLENLADTRLGKKLILTTRDKWDIEDIIEGYHNQYVIEHVFREMKHRDRGTWWPLNHWTDQKIRVHGLYCTIAILLRSLIWRRVHQHKLKLSLDRLWGELAGIREVVNVFKRKRRAKSAPTQTVLTKLNPAQEKLFKILELNKGMRDL